MDRQLVEQSFVACLLRLPGEPEDAPLDRINSLRVWPSTSDIKSRLPRIVAQMAFKFAKSERSITPKFAAAHLRIPETTLLTWVELADPQVFETYADLLIQHQQADKLADVVQEAVGKTRAGDTRTALDDLSDQIAALQLATSEEAIVSLHEATKQFLEWYEHYQQEMQSGKVRWSFQFEALNDMVPYVFPGHAILITAASKVGKSSLCQQLFDHNIQRGLKGIFFHFEDSPEVMGLKRTARQMITVTLPGGEIIGLSQKKLLKNILTSDEMDVVAYVNSQVLQWKNNGKFVHCAGWTMEQVTRVVTRYRDWLDFFVIDYIGKEFFPPGKLRNHGGPFGAAAYDAELIKTVADRYGKIAIVVQQEHEGGGIYGSKQAWQKFQVWLSLSRHRDEQTRSLSGTYRSAIGQPGQTYDGTITVQSANMGQTGEIQANFYPEFGLWSA